MLGFRSGGRVLFASLAVTTAGCGLLGLSGPAVKIETIASGFPSGPVRDSTLVGVRPGTVVLETSIGYGMPGYAIDAIATDENGELRVDVETKQTDATVLVARWFARYRLTVKGVDAGAYRLRLLWHNRLGPSVLQLRDMVDTLIMVP